MRTFEDRQLFWAVLQNFETTIIKLRKHHCHHCQSTPGWGLFLYCIKCANYPSCGEYERQQSPQLLSYPPTFSSSALRHLQSSVTLAHSILTYSQIYQDAGLDGAILRTEGGNWQQTAQLQWLYSWHIHIFIRISIILGNEASCLKITQPHFPVYFISPPIICHTRSPYSYIFHGTFWREGGRMVKIAQKLPDAHFPSFVAGVRSTLSPGLKCQQQL